MSTERRLKITPGKKPAKAGPENGVGYGPVVSIDGRILCHTVIWPNHDDSWTNATLYADAHNTANECDMLPSELLAHLTELRRERDEAVASLKKCVWELEKARQELVSCRPHLGEYGQAVVNDRIQRIKEFLSTLNTPTTDGQQ